MYTKENCAKISKLNELAPELMKAFWAFDKASVAEGAIPVRELRTGGGCASRITINVSARWNARHAGAVAGET
jgi:hypothetical protein